MTDLEYDYLREKAYIHAEKEALEKELLKEELELKPAKINVTTKIKNYDTQDTKSN